MVLRVLLAPPPFFADGLLAIGPTLFEKYMYCRQQGCIRRRASRGRLDRGSLVVEKVPTASRPGGPPKGPDPARSLRATLNAALEGIRGGLGPSEAYMSWSQTGKADSPCWGPTASTPLPIRSLEKVSGCIKCVTVAVTGQPRSREVRRTRPARAKVLPRRGLWA